VRGKFALHLHFCSLIHCNTTLKYGQHCIPPWVPPSIIVDYTKPLSKYSKSVVIFIILGALNLGSPRHVFKVEGNSWIQQIEDQVILGVSHVMDYIRTPAYQAYVTFLNIPF